ncbi:ArsR/SmtB family transcription factor [Aeromicrobium fastidiosum]|uniref:Winged helix-turn-helix transcriptional regulator n=1 Tax=Aeromicrobium fastidiosum TaxID=52699 RepID=A0A641ANG8_9ACTN|nr:metalloregulator ArsR/SmtB family transcription factor [Aeromicrobium fastidiosum]KAA1378818.1 winged helix-turn-helix transcriptional regulator [Aeromicrobium fastidiosum]
MLDTAEEATAKSAASCLFRGLADPSRLAILELLASQERRVVDVTKHLGLAQSTVSTHLACLRDCGLVSSRSEGRATVYSLTEPNLTRAVLAAADGLLQATGEAVSSCVNFGTRSTNP